MKANTLLGGLLVVQLVLVGVTWLPGSGSDQVSTVEVLQIEADDIQKLSIARKPKEGEERSPVVLSRTGDDWVLSSAGEYPADTAKVEEVLDKLSALKRGQRVATRATSHGALKVGDADYGKWVEVEAGGQTTALYIGAARSNSVHVRKAGEDDVYLARGLSEWALKDSTRGYLDDTYVSFEPENLSAFSIENEQGAFTLTNTEGVWTSDGLTLDPEKVNELLRKASSIRISEPVGRDVKPEHGLDRGVRVSWSLEEGEVSVDHAYVIGADDDRTAYVKSDDSDFVIKAAKTTVDPLREASLTGLLADEEPS